MGSWQNCCNIVWWRVWFLSAGFAWRNIQGRERSSRLYSHQEDERNQKIRKCRKWQVQRKTRLIFDKSNTLCNSSLNHWPDLFTVDLKFLFTAKIKIFYVQITDNKRVKSAHEQIFQFSIGCCRVGFDRILPWVFLGPGHCRDAHDKWVITDQWWRFGSFAYDRGKFV